MTTGTSEGSLRRREAVMVMTRKLVAEAVGTALLVVLAVGVATLSFGFGATGPSVSAGVVATALAFGLTLLVLAYALGPVSGCHINPAVTLGALLTRRLTVREATGYWVAQVAGGILGALLLWAIFSASPRYHRSVTGLGANGYGRESMIRLGVGGALVTEIVLTAVFVFVVLSVTRAGSPPVVAGVVIGLSLTMVHLIGIPLTGTSVNPARSIGPALIVGGTALSQLWLFIVAPLAGGALAAAAHELLVPTEPPRDVVSIPEQPTAAEPQRAGREAEIT
jgi:aquaporin Z